MAIEVRRRTWTVEDDHRMIEAGVLTPAVAGRAVVGVQTSVTLLDRSEPEPDSSLAYGRG